MMGRGSAEVSCRLTAYIRSTTLMSLKPSKLKLSTRMHRAEISAPRGDSSPFASALHAHGARSLRIILLIFFVSFFFLDCYMMFFSTFNKILVGATPPVFLKNMGVPSVFRLFSREITPCATGVRCTLVCLVFLVSLLGY